MIIGCRSRWSRNCKISNNVNIAECRYVQTISTLLMMITCGAIGRVLHREGEHRLGRRRRWWWVRRHSRQSTPYLLLTLYTG